MKSRSLVVASAALVVTAAVVSVAASVAARAPVACAQEPKAETPGTSVTPETQVADLMKRMRANEGAVRVGMPVTAADVATPGAAKLIDQRYLSLGGSWLDPERRLQGTVDWDVDLETETSVDSIRAVLVTAKFDRKAMGKAIEAAGKAIGLDLAPDEEDPFTWFDHRATGIELWISVGDGVVVVESELAD